MRLLTTSLLLHCDLGACPYTTADAGQRGCDSQTPNSLDDVQEDAGFVDDVQVGADHVSV